MVDSKPPKPAALATGPKAKAERLAEALRDNLKKRKAQARAQAVTAPSLGSQAKKNSENR